MPRLLQTCDHQLRLVTVPRNWYPVGPDTESEHVEEHFMNSDTIASIPVTVLIAAKNEEDGAERKAA